jgi:PAS domain S-box-containing protein
MATAEVAEGSQPASPGREIPDPNVLLRTFQGVVEKLRGQEMELARLKADRGDVADEGFPAESLAKSLTSGMMAFDADGVLRLVNPAALQILGRSHSEMIGNNAENLFGAADGLGRLLGEGLRQAAPRSREMVPHRRPDGREIHLGVGLSPIRKEDGKLRGLICLLSDLTEIRQLRDRVALKENLAHLGEISAGIAHEFRNSLATLQGYARLLLRCREEETEELARSILKEAEGIGKVVEEFLQFARPATLNLGAVDLEAMLQALAREMSEPASAPPFNILLAGDLPAVVGDENLLRRAFHNLFLNSSQARNGEGIEVRVVGTLEERRILRLEVADNGPGIPAEVLPRIFTPFFTTRPNGTGLGLPLVQKAIVSHDGSIEVASQIGLGTRFVIRLPLVGPPENPAHL